MAGEEQKKSKYEDIMPKVTNPPDYVRQSSQNKRKPKKKKNQAPDGVAMLKQAGENQQKILQTPEAKQKFKDTQDPFKNGFFKSKEELYRKNTAAQNADKIIQQNGAAERKNIMDVAREEQSNAQKLFAPAKPDIQTDAQGNKLAMRNGQPVGYSGNPAGAASVQQGDRGSPNTLLGMTDAERASNQSNIQNVASQFKPVMPKPPTQSPNQEQFSMPQVAMPQQQIPQTRVASTPQGLPNDTPNAWADASRQQGMFAGMPQIKPQISQPSASPTGYGGAPSISWTDLFNLYPNFSDPLAR